MNPSTTAHEQTMDGRPTTLAEAVVATARRHPERPALMVDGQTHTYDELITAAARLSHLIDEVDTPTDSLVAIHGSGSFWVYAGILGALLSGRGYVPLNPSFPDERSSTMVTRAGASTLIVAGGPAGGSAEEGPSLVARHPDPLTLVIPEVDTVPAWATAGDRPAPVATGADLVADPTVEAPPVDPADTAYLLFTSGTTGDPKGIGIPHDRVMAYLTATLDRYDLGPDDRCSQNFSLTFDLSVHDLFVSWSAGACLCVPSGRSVMAPGPFVRDQALTSWFSTPTTAALMLKLRMLQPGAFPSLRWSLFCGEALPTTVADAWLQAAPGSVVDNLYGPTEATIACTAHRHQEPGADGLVPIGRPFGTTRTAVVDDQLRPVPPGQAGELLLGGGQLAPGYWRDPERSAASFVTVADLDPAGPWYRTGDRVVDDGATLIYRGRIDDQIKIRGHRVELGEVETVLRRVSGAATAVALGWPRTPAGADGIVAFVAGTGIDSDAVLQGCRQALPDYMVPSRLHCLDTIPQNASGKADRKQLLAIHQEGT